MKNSYPCSQTQLYTVAEMAWNTHLLYIGDFTAFLPKYSVKHFEEMINLIHNTRDIKIKQDLNKDVTKAKTDLINAKDEMLICYKSLKEYIKEGGHFEHLRLFKPTAKYRKACNNNWKECYDIAGFLTNSVDNTLIMLNNEGITPAGFSEQCKSVADNYFAAYQKLYISKRTAYELSGKKVIYCNSIYTELTTMLRHAQIIYSKKPEMQAVFCFDRMLKIQKRKGKVVGEIQPSKAKNPLAFFSRVASMF
ncbi:MAG: hypothetical protein IPJ79_16660 [Bacteroidetes bacterium]|nr:hypothetical protein [Bacteroidota bacterium]